MLLYPTSLLQNGTLTYAVRSALDGYIHTQFLGRDQSVIIILSRVCTRVWVYLRLKHK